MVDEVTVDHLDKAILIATEAHAGQRDKAGQPYILHPLRVMLSLFTLEEKIVGVLHDVIEDTPVRLEHLTHNFPTHILEALDALTHRKGETYSNYIFRIQTMSLLAVRVKLADLKDNMNKDRIPYPSERDVKRWEKYELAYTQLTT